MPTKILIVGDTHGVNANLRKVAEKIGSHIDLMVHLGDFMCDPKVIEGLVDCPVEIVRGNCDSDLSVPRTKVIQIAGHKAFITHGHDYGAGLGIDAMRDAAKKNGADVVMFGHTHEPLIDLSSDVAVVNPGSLTKPRQDGRVPTYAVMTVDDRRNMDFSIVALK